MRRATLEMLVALGLAGACVVGAVEAASFPRESAYLPTALLVAGAVLSLIWAVQSLAARMRADEAAVVRVALPAAEARRLAIIGVGVPGLVLAIQVLGFFTAFALVVPALAYALGYRSLRGLAVGVALFIGLLYLAFVVILERPLPPEIWRGLLG